MVRPLALLVAATIASPFSASGSSVSASEHIVAVGDLHGDFSAWQMIAQNARLMTPSGHWSAGKTILVQMGDITDREPDSLKIIRSLQQLQREAPRKGGKVIVILGNHEAMNLLGDNRYTTAGEYAAFADDHSGRLREDIYNANRARLEAVYKARNPALGSDQVRAQWMTEHPLGWVEHKLAWEPSGELGRWAASNPAIVKIGAALFVHGGISAEYSKQPVEAVNARVANAMMSADDSPTSVLTDPLGPLWYRGLVVNDPDANAVRAAMKPPAAPLAPDEELTGVLSSYGATRLIVAHTPNLAGIRIVANGRLACIDTGISRYYHGALTWLEINGESMIPHNVPRTQ